jgi:hypothetical protein
LAIYCILQYNYQSVDLRICKKLKGEVARCVSISKPTTTTEASDDDSGGIEQGKHCSTS